MRRKLQLSKMLSRLNPVHTRHHNIHDQHVGPQPFGHFDGFLPIGSLAHHMDVTCLFEQRTDAGSYHKMVFSNQYAYHESSSTLPLFDNGNCADRIVPRFEVELMLRVPPAMVIRSRRPASPMPFDADFSWLKPIPLSCTVR